MENLDNINHPSDNFRSSLDQDASLAKAMQLSKSDEFIGGETSASTLVNSNQAGEEAVFASNSVTHHGLQEANPSLKNSGTNTSETFAKCNRNKANGGNKKGSPNETPEIPRDQGMIDSLVGAAYQQKLLIVMLCYVAKIIEEKEELDFEMSSEDIRGGIFDDIGFRFKDGDQWTDLFIQAKHKEDKTKAITWDDLTSTDKRAPFAVSKYLKSFLHQQWDTANEPPVLVLCTNIGLAEEVRTQLSAYPFGTSVVDLIVKSISNEAYQIVPNNLKEDIKARLFDYLRKNSDLFSLAKQIAQHIHNKTTVDFRNPLLQKYRYAIEKHIAITKSVANECYEVNESFFNETVAIEFKKVFEKEYQNLLKGNNLDIWNDVRKKGIRFKKGLPTKECDLPKQLEDNQIHKFFASFIIICNTNHEKDDVIASIREKEVLSSDIQGLVSSEITYEKLAKWIMDWMKDKTSKHLVRQDIVDLFKYITASLRFSQIKGMSNLYCNEMQILKLQCKPDVMEEKKLFKAVKRWLSQKSEKNSFKVTIQHCNNLPLIATVLQYLKLTMDYVFFKSEWLKNKKTFREVLDTFHVMNFSLIMVIDCKRNSEAIEMIEWWAEGKLTETRKMILIINAFHHNENILVGDLTEESRKKMFEENKSMMLCGTEVPVQELFDEKDNLNLVLDIKTLPEGTGIKGNINKLNFKKIKNNYIPRRMKKCENEFAHEISSDVFWNLRFNDPSNKLERDAIDKFTLEDFLDHIGSHNLEYIKFVRENERPMAQTGAVETNTSKNGSSGRDSDYFYQVEKYNLDLNVHSSENEIESKVCVILNEAGSGKTFFMTWLASELQSRNPSWWIVKFNLNEYSTDFDQFDKDKRDIEAKLMSIRQLFQLIYLAFCVRNKFDPETDKKRKTAQEAAKSLVMASGLVELDESKMQHLNAEQFVLLKIFLHKFSSNQLAILMDGFDEITPYYKTVVLRLLSNLDEFDGITKIYLSSRPYDFRSELQETFKECSFNRLVELNREEQHVYIHRVLLANFEGYASCFRKIQEQMFNIITRLLTTFLGNFMELPLFLYMGLELLLPIVIKHVNLELRTISSQIMDDCEQQFALLNLVESFMEKKLTIANIEKTGANVTIAQTSASKSDSELKLERLETIFSQLALFAVLSKGEVRQLLSELEHKNALLYMEKIKKGSEKSGICEGVVSNVPLFIHRLFAEYFAALWFFTNRSSKTVKDFLKRHVFETNNRKEIKYFLDSMICKEKQLHMAILDHSKLKVEGFLKQNEQMIKAKDVWGRTPIHLALAYGSKENYDIVSLLLQRTPCNILNSKDAYFGWTAFDFALIRDKLNGTGVYFELFLVKKLFQKGASMNVIETLTRFQAEAPFEMLGEALPLVFHLSHELVPSLGKTHAIDIINSLIKKIFFQYDLDLQMMIPTNKMYAMVRSYNANLAKAFEVRNLIESRMPLLEICIVADSLLLEALFGNWIDDENICSKKSELIHLAFEFRSINVLRYLINDDSLPEGLTFGQELMLLLVYMNEDECMFKKGFHNYCIRYKIDCLEEKESPLVTEEETSNMDEKRISLQGELWRYFPAMLEFGDLGIDSGTEFLLSRALQIDNTSIVEYLLLKTKATVNNQFIKSILQNCAIDWRCQTSFHFLIRKSTDLRKGDGKGQTLLHFAVDEARSCMVKCLIDHYEFNTTERNAKENKWNAFFYCVSKYSDKSDVRKNIFTYMMQQNPSYDYFNEKDSYEKGVFYYAVKHNRTISDYIIQNEFSTQLKYLNADQIILLVKLLKTAGFDAEEMLEYVSNVYLEEAASCLKISYALLMNEVLYYTDRMNRNLLHIAIRNNWFLFIRCLVESFAFDITNVNTEENSWNSFFYCVIEKETESIDVKKQIFKYLLEKQPMNCFDQLDTERKSVFWYATRNNKKIGIELFKRERYSLENFPCEKQLSVLMGRLQKTTLDAFGKLIYLKEINLFDENSMKSIFEFMKTTGDLNYRDEVNGRNLLQIAIKEGWLIVTKCLIEQFDFDAKAINEKEKNWNAFFYCVGNQRKTTEKLKIFTYLVEKYPIDCFDHLDSNGNSVYYYVKRNNWVISSELFKRECKLTENLPIDERTSILMDRIKIEVVNAYGKLQYLAKQDLIDEKSVKGICNYMKINGELNYKDKVNGRNLLQLAIWDGWFILTKCLIEDYEFDIMQINKREKNWNAFFYCVGNKKKTTDKLTIFTYLMGRNRMDCFHQLDSEGKSIFWYAKRNEWEISSEIFKQECKLTEKLPIKEQISVLFAKLNINGLTAYGKLWYFEKNYLIHDNSIQSICNAMRFTGDLKYKDEKNGRNLLHIAIVKGWFILSKCLIEHYWFNAEETNEKENNWNAFYYCVSNQEQTTEKLNIFSFLLENNEMDYFNYLDSEGKSVFWYANRNNKQIAKKIIKTESQLTEENEERRSSFIEKLQKSLNMGCMEARNLFEEYMN